MTDLNELDKAKAELESDFPGWRVWYVPGLGRGVMWCAQPEPLINAVSPEWLRILIRHAHESVSKAPALCSIDEYAASAPTIWQAEVLHHHSDYEPRIHVSGPPDGTIEVQQTRRTP